MIVAKTRKKSVRRQRGEQRKNKELYLDDFIISFVPECLCLCVYVFCMCSNGLIVKRNAANLFIKRFLFIKENTIKDCVY